jgi:hypothetical protein
MARRPIMTESGLAGLPEHLGRLEEEGWGNGEAERGMAWAAPAAPDGCGYPFNSFLSSLKKRQSVPWAIIFWGVLLIKPISCRRKA